MEYWLDWARGPAFIFSFSFMILGLARHLALTLWDISRVWRRAGDKTLPRFVKDSVITGIGFPGDGGVPPRIGDHQEGQVGILLSRRFDHRP